MPKVRRKELPDALFQHLLTRAREREISRADIVAFAAWLDTDPEVPVGEWFKRFPGMTVCGEGELVKTFLVRGQMPHGQEVR
jgi:hypothetical protein